MRCACVDIGSNTTALLVADVDGDGLHPVGARRTFTMLGAALKDGRIGDAKIEEVCDTVKTFVKYARRLNAERISVVATHVIREAGDGDELTREVEEHCGLPVRVLTTAEEARYSFAGAVGGLAVPTRATAVIDAGGGSTEVTWCAAGGDPDDLRTESFAIGSSSLRREYLRSDPPTADELTAARDFADQTFAALDVPSNCGVALAVGGGATTAREIVGGLIDPPSVDRILELVMSMESEQLADRLEIEWQRARLLPAGLTVLAAVSARLGLPLEVGLGGLREGVLHELAA